MPTTTLAPTRGETFFLNGAPVHVTYAKRSEAPAADGGCKTSDLAGGKVNDTGWYIEYRTQVEGPIVDANTPGLHRVYLADVVQT